MAKNKNPLNKDEVKNPTRVEPDIETDKFSVDEGKSIVDMVMKDHKHGSEVMSDWLQQRKKDLEHYLSELPSRIELLDKKDWQSDRNLGLAASVCDAFQATLLSTCWNPDTIHFVATEKNDVDNKRNLERFTKWMVGKNEVNMFPEVDDFIHNRITQGFSVFKIYWKVWYEWVDKRIHKKTGGYRIKTEKIRFEKAIVKNVANLEDIILPSYGDDIQDLPFFIQIIHKTGEKLMDEKARKMFKNVNQTFIDKLKNVCLEEKQKLISKVKADKLGISDITDEDMRVFPIDIIEWYGQYTKNGKTERYRFHVEPYTRTFLAGKPVRKINRAGKIPFVGGPLIRIPGYIRGRSIPNLIAPVCNQFNNVFNQISDFQYINNVPFGFYNPDEGSDDQVTEIIPGLMKAVEGDPSKAVYFPNLSRSMAWGYQHINLLFEMLERLTGAGSFFMSNKEKQGTATRDMLINEQSETRFSLWVKRLQYDICDAIGMTVQLYQDWAPPKLGERVIGKEGKELIRNLSVDTLRGSYDVNMSPDVLSGSKAYERQIQMWALETLSQGCVWVSPQVNPNGNYNLWADGLKVMKGMQNVERYLGQEPPDPMGKSPDLDDEWSRFMQGDDFEPPEGATGIAFQHLIGHMKQKVEKYHELDEEYRPLFDKHLFATQVNVSKFIASQKQEQQVNQMAEGMMNERPQEPTAPQPPGAQPRMGAPEAPLPAMPGAGQVPQPGVSDQGGAQV